MGMVTMSHPDLPGQDIEVSELAVPIHRQSGWQTVDEKTSRTETTVGVTTPAAGAVVEYKE